MDRNGFKAALARGETQVGCWVALAEDYAAEVAGEAGFDWLLIDGEHGPNDIRSMRRQLSALGRSASHPVIRLRVADVALVKQAMDIGAQSLLIPMVESGAQAALMAQAMRYPPDGIRGMGATLARASRFGGIRDYAMVANAEACLLVQVETRAGLAALDDILRVPGVDGVFVGPADLSADMGYPGRPDTPEVVSAIADALRRIRAGGKAAGIIAFDAAQAREWMALGANFIAVGADVLVLANGLRALAAAFR